MGTEKRQRHKDNRQARLEAERAATAKAKRRRQLITTVAVSLVLFGVLAFIAGRGNDDAEVAVPPDTSAPAGDEPEAPPDSAPPAETPTVSTIAPGPKPEVVVPEGDLPTELVIEDLIEGEGEESQEGDQVVVHYVGVAASTGEEFDSSWDGPAFGPMEVGASGTVPGFDQGLAGMKVGGRRQLTIPPDLGYGEQGSPPAIGPNETLVFVIELVGLAPGE